MLVRLSKRSGIQVKLELSSLFGRLRRDVELALFRVVQESLTNIHRHSGSNQAKIRIDRNAQLTLEISDAGRAYSATTPQTREPQRPEFGVGISSMQERVKLIGGCFDVDFAGHGTTVRVTLPLEGELT
jgi:signal transduction histidine kinase